MSGPTLKPGDRVTHVLEATRSGLVTTVIQNFNGFLYRVCWAHDIEEATHFGEELEKKKPVNPGGFQ